MIELGAGGGHPGPRPAQGIDLPGPRGEVALACVAVPLGQRPKPGVEVVEPDAGISTATDTLTMPDLPSLLADRP